VNEGGICPIAAHDGVERRFSALLKTLKILRCVTIVTFSEINPWYLAVKAAVAAVELKFAKPTPNILRTDSDMTTTLLQRRTRFA
jgi:hypothetical protein